MENFTKIDLFLFKLDIDKQRLFFYNNNKFMQGVGGFL